LNRNDLATDQKTASTVDAASRTTDRPSTTGGGLAGWILPSLSDFAFVAVLGWLFWSATSAAALLGDGDAGWHIRLGEMALADGRLPHTDPFSFTMAGRVWFAWEWLADVILALAHQADGLEGVVLLAGVVIALSSCLMIRYMLWLQVNALVAILATLLVCSVSTMHWLARPHMFTWGFLIATLWLLESDRRKPSWRVWTLIPMAVLWTNIHGGWVALIVTSAIFAVGAGLEELWCSAKEDGWRLYLPASTKRYALVCLLCGAATVINPYGIQLHAHVGDYLQSDFILNHVEEFQSPRFRSESMRVLEVLLFASVFAAAFMVRRGEFVRPLLMLAWAHASLTSVRHAPLFVIVAVPYIGIELTRLIRTAAKDRWMLAEVFQSIGKDYAGENRIASERGPVLGWLPIAGVIAAAMLLHDRADTPGKAAFPSVLFPALATDVLGEQLSTKRILTSDQWGDYLIYRLFPRYQAFIDGRSDFYDPEIRDDYLSVLGSSWKAGDILDKYEFEGALLPLDWTITAAMKQSPDWRVVYDDGFAVYFERRGIADSLRLSDQREVADSPSSPIDGGSGPEGILLGSLK
jgi:hypothetical protein